MKDHPEVGRPIRCRLCRTCNERNVEIAPNFWVPSGTCLYGGPFQGWLLPDGTKEDNNQWLSTSGRAPRGLQSEN